MPRRIVPIAACLCLLAPAAARAATIFVVKGAGFGHGVGMSQYGAYGYALHGWGYRRILGHYYTGTTIGTSPRRSIRVLLQSSRRSITVTGVSAAGSRRLDPAHTYVAKPSGAGISLRDSGGGRAKRFGGPVGVRGARGFVLLGGSADNGVTGGSYRGTIELRPGASGGVTAINVVGLEAYVRGVIPGEVSSSWPAEALKAQAVAARSYGLATDAGGAVFDQYAGTLSQLYKGMSAEQPTTTAAQQATAGQVVLSQGQVAITYFFSTSGGRTENVENVFLGVPPSPYLKSVKDPYDDTSPRHRWQVRYSQAQMQAKLGALCRGRFRGITVVTHGVSPRVVTADVRCSGGRTRTTGATLRWRLGLYDTWFGVTRASSASGRATRAVSADRVAIR
jgi:stage II sporulation protein D